MNRKRLIAILVFLCFLVPSVCHGLAKENEVLAGLKGIMVVVEDMDPEIESLGLTRDKIVTDVELRLRKVGIKVLEKNEWLAIPGNPYLYINIIAIRLKTRPIFAYSIRVEVREAVKLIRQINSHYDVVAITWQKGMIGKADTDIVIREIRQLVVDEVDIFVNQYLAANPK